MRNVLNSFSVLVVFALYLSPLGCQAASFIPPQSTVVLLVGLPGLRCGLVVDEVVGVERLKLDRLQPSLSGREFTRGIGPQDTVLLDIEALLKSGRFNVSDD